jgi:predicted dehydrogenase
VLMAGHIFLHAAAVRMLKQLIDTGELGDVRYLYSRRTSLGPRAREEVSVVWDYLAHDAYIIPYLLGELPETVSASGGAYLRQGIADVVFTTMRFSKDIIATCQASWYDDMNAETPLVIHDSGYEAREGIDEFGNRGLRRYDDGVKAVAAEGEQPLMAQCRAFLKRVSNNATSRTEEEGVLGTTLLLEAVERSLHGGSGWETLKTPEKKVA